MAYIMKSDAWFPDVWTCRCNNSAQDLSIVQPICSSVGGQDLTLDSPHPTLGYLVWVSSTAVFNAYELH